MAKTLIVSLYEGLTDWEVDKLVSRIKKLAGVADVEIEDEVIEEYEAAPADGAADPVGANGDPDLTGWSSPQPEPTPVMVRDDRERVIYEWCDPDTGTPVYVGKTLTFTTRISAQLRTARQPSLDKWLHDQLLQGKKPMIRQVAKVRGSQAADREERARIYELSNQGIILLNKTAGNASVLDEVTVKFLA